MVGVKDEQALGEVQVVPLLKTTEQNLIIGSYYFK